MNTQELIEYIQSISGDDARDMLVMLGDYNPDILWKLWDMLQEIRES